MGGLAHYIEGEGVPTTQISLVREHTQAIRPPRALWVSFELGRPLGVPNDAAFQRRVLVACLKLAEAATGPVLVDYPEDIPAAHAAGEAEGLVCAVAWPPTPSEDSDMTRSLLAEIGRIAPWYGVAVEARGRTTVGLGPLAVEDAARFVARYIDDPSAPSPDPAVATGEMLKLCSEDLKAFYSEAISAQPGMDTGLAVEHFLWNETVLGKVLWALRAVAIESDDPFTSYFGKRLLIPDRQLHHRGAQVFETKKSASD